MKKYSFIALTILTLTLLAASVGLQACGNSSGNAPTSGNVSFYGAGS